MNEFDILNNVKVDLSEYTLEEVNEIEKRMLLKDFKRNIKKNNGKRKVIIAAMLCIVASSVFINSNDVLAVMSEFKHNISTWLGVGNKDYHLSLGETLRNGDIEITLNEFFVNENTMVINLDTNKEFNYVGENINTFIPDYYVDGKEISVDKTKVQYSLREVNGKSNVIIEVNTEKLLKKEDVDVQLNFQIGNDIDIKYNFIYNMEKYNKDIRHVIVDKELAINESSIYIEKLIVKPDKIEIVGNTKGISPWIEDKAVKYYYDILDNNGDMINLKAPIGENAYFYLNESSLENITIKLYSIDKLGNKVFFENKQLDIEIR